MIQPKNDGEMISKARQRLAPIANRAPKLSIENTLDLLKTMGDWDLAEFIPEFLESFPTGGGYQYDIRFEKGMTQFDTYHYNTLHQIAERAMSHLAKRHWVVVGHATPGESEKNPSLAAERARIVATELTTRGVPTELLEVIPHLPTCRRCVRNPDKSRVDVCLIPAEGTLTLLDLWHLLRSEERHRAKYPSEGESRSDLNKE